MHAYKAPPLTKRVTGIKISSCFYISSTLLKFERVVTTLQKKKKKIGYAESDLPEL